MPYLHLHCFNNCQLLSHLYELARNYSYGEGERDRDGGVTGDMNGQGRRGSEVKETNETLGKKKMII